MIEPIIDDYVRITTILVNTRYETSYLVHYLTKEFKNRELMLWQDMDIYMPCKRIKLGFNSDLIDLLHHYKDEFDVLIVDRLKDQRNVQETINFIKEFRKSEDFANKQLIILVYAKNDNDVSNKKIELDDYVNLKDTILGCSTRIYTYEKETQTHFSVINVKKHEITSWHTYSESVFITLASDK